MSNGTITMTGAEYDALAGKIAALEAELAKMRAVLDGFVLVPVEPTPEMVSAAEEAHMPFGDMDIALRMAILSAPSAPATVQGVNTHLKGCQENDMLHIAGLVAERDTLRQQLAERDAEILEQCRLHGMGAERELKLMAQRDRLAGLLRMVRQDDWYHPLEEHEIAQIDAALAKLGGKA